MLDRRQIARDNEIFEKNTGFGEKGSSPKGSLVNHNDNAVPDRVHRGRSLLAKITWWRDNFVSLAFGPETLPGVPVSDLAARLRRSERKKRKLQRRINELLRKE